MQLVEFSREAPAERQEVWMWMGQAWSLAEGCAVSVFLYGDNGVCLGGDVDVGGINSRVVGDGGTGCLRRVGMYREEYERRGRLD